MGLFSETAPVAPEAPARPEDLRVAQASLRARRADLIAAIEDSFGFLGSYELTRIMTETGLAGSPSAAADMDPANLSEQGLTLYVAEARRELAVIDRRVVTTAEELTARDSRVTPAKLAAFYATTGIQPVWRVVLEGTLSYVLSTDPGTREDVLTRFESAITAAGGTSIVFSGNGQQAGVRIERA